MRSLSTRKTDGVALLHTLQSVRTKPVEIEFLDDYIEKMGEAAWD
jgi:hypothetical protein